MKRGHNVTVNKMGNTKAVILPEINQSQNQLVQLRINLHGNTFVGKTCLARTYETGEFTENTCLRIGVSRHTRSLKVQNTTTEVQIWNVIGHERYHDIWPIFIRRAHGSLLLYDVADGRTFLELPKWLETVRKYNPEAIIFIIGARSDLVDRKEVSRETGQKFARRENLEFFECSAKTGENVKEVFEHMALRILQKKGLIPPDKTEIEGKSLEWNEPKEVLNLSVAEEEVSYASVNETVILQLKPQDTSPPGNRSIQVGSGGQENHNMSSQSSDKESSELKEGSHSSDDKENPPSISEKSVLSEDEMQIEGKCPTWFS